MQEKEYVSQEDLKDIRAASKKRDNAIQSLSQAEKLAIEAKTAHLEHQVTVQHMFIKYKLGFDDQINEGTGEISRAVVEEKE